MQFVVVTRQTPTRQRSSALIKGVVNALQFAGEEVVVVTEME